MKKVSSLFLAMAVFCLPVMAGTNFSGKSKPQPIVIEPALNAPQLGEKIEFEVFWMGVPIGFGRLEVRDKLEEKRGRKAYHVVATAGSNDFLSKICKVHDEIHSFIDAETLLPLEFAKDIREGRYRASETIVYNHAAGLAYYESKTNGSKKEIQIPDNAHDIVSAFFYFRTQNPKKGDVLKLPVVSDEKLWEVELDVQKLEMKELRRQKPVPAMMVEPLSKMKGVLAQRGRCWVHFSVDKTRKPLWITMKTPFGPIQGVLKEGF